MQNKEIRLLRQGTLAVFKAQFTDPDNDSLSFQLTPCFASNYYMPGNVLLDKEGNVSFSKDSIAKYAFSIIITEWRKNASSTYINIGSSQCDFVMDIAVDVSLKESTSNRSFNFYPNPVSSILNITDEQNELQYATIEIKNALGQTILSAGFQKEIDVSLLESGIYFVQIKTNDKKLMNAKFIKQ